MATSELDISYAAGLFDGEGCVNVSTNAAYNHGHPNRNTRVILQITISNTCKAVLEWLQSTFGGSIRAHHNIKKLRPEHKLGYNWTLSEQQAASFLRLIRPSLKVKGAVAEIGIKLAKLKEGRGPRRLTPEEVEERLSLVAECRRLNHRGQ